MARNRGKRHAGWFLAEATLSPHLKYAVSRFDRPFTSVVDYAAAFPFISIFDVSERQGAIGAVDASELTRLLPDATRGIGSLNWTALLAPRPFPAPHPVTSQMPAAPQPPEVSEIAFPKRKPLPEPPSPTQVSVSPSIWQRLVPAARVSAERRARQLADDNYRSACHEWESEVAYIKSKNAAAFQSYERKKAEQLLLPESLAYAEALAHWRKESVLLEGEHLGAVARWQDAKMRWEGLADAERSRIAELQTRYLAADREAIELTTVLILKMSRYPHAFPQNLEIHYKPENRIAVVNYQLPDFQLVDILKDGKKIGLRQKTQLQEDALYAIPLRTIHEVAVSDKIDAVDSVVFNGWVHFIDGATGKPRSEYILSVHATKVQLATIDIARVNPIECFRALKGLSAKQISAYTPVAPILTLNKDDDRLVEGRAVIDGLSSFDNLAAMDWETFEHLVRELFEKEFSKPGTEVRITRASRDRGVDAIVYDPDPIRGGKYVVQAKKYTNTVDVSAVRDLFGTVQSEGANRGLLVTTSQFGPDAYEFAKDKNITLLDGPNLLHLFEKHGYKFRIDLREARQVMGLTT